MQIVHNWLGKGVERCLCIVYLMSDNRPQYPKITILLGYHYRMGVGTGGGGGQGGQLAMATPLFGLGWPAMLSGHPTFGCCLGIYTYTKS